MHSYNLTQTFLLNDHSAIGEARAQLRAKLIEGAVSPKTTLLNDSFIEKLRQESKKRMGLKNL
jgi:hypothetical protein